MLLKSCQSVLPDTLYVSEGILLPLFYTVNHLNGEIPLPTPGKMAPQLCALLPNLLAVTTMPHVEGVSARPSVLLGAQLAGNEVHCVPALTCEVVAHPVF